MMTEPEKLNGHEKFKELCALAYSGALNSDEWAELNSHLQICEECWKAYEQYKILATEGMPHLAALYGQLREQEKWDDTASRRQILAHLQPAEENQSGLPVHEPATGPPAALQLHFLQRIPVKFLSAAAVAACLLVAAGLGAYRLGSRAKAKAEMVQASVEQAKARAENSYQKLMAEKASAGELLKTQASKLAELQKEYSKKERELAGIRSALKTQEERAVSLAAARVATDNQLRAALQARDDLNGRLQETEQAYQKTQAEILSLRNQRSNAVARNASLESKIEELAAIKRGQERRLRVDEDYLSYDRDIRELMGARNLYIADVFDVDSGSRTRKPFGRVFYTEGKSLLFYAFDLDRQSHLKTASAFQAWGQKDTGEARPISLGILYKDSKSDRRWVLKCDNPKQLAAIDAVFVTVEPHGGSSKPTGKPFLYAWLRKEPNHP
ncbi:MAG: anti-sigma factor domain-containing protein [Terriglobia bacterium]